MQTTAARSALRALPRWALLFGCALLAGRLAAQTATAPGSNTTKPVTTAATTTGAGPSWSALRPDQQRILAPLAAYWQTIDASRKAKWLEVAARYPGMHPEEQVRVQARMAEWARMTPAERGRARLTFQESRTLSREEKQALWEAYSSFSPEARQNLAEHGERKRTEPAKPVAVKPLPIDTTTAGPNRVQAAIAAPPVKAVAPTVVQARPGATTVPMTRTSTAAAERPIPPVRISASPTEVNRQTLLPVSKPKAASAPEPAAPAAEPSPAASAAAAAASS